MTEEFSISTTLNASASTVYYAWLDSEKHSAFTGGEASILGEINSEFTAWDAYISGKIIELNPEKRILHTWRTVEFKENEEDSILEVSFKDVENGKCSLTIKHSELPIGGAKKYSIGWEENYFQPMRDYFEKP